MKKGWNRWSTQKTKGMARRTPLERWNGLAWVCTPWLWKRENGLAGVCMEWLWKGLARCGGEESSGTTVFPQTQRVRLVFLCVGVTEPLPFLPQGQAMSARAHKQTTAQATIQEVLHRSRCFAPGSSRARGLIRGWIQTAWRMEALPKKSHQRSQSTGCVLVRKAPTTLTQSGNSTVDFTQSGNSTTGQRQRGLPRDDRDGVAGNSLRQSVHTPFTWPGCEVELGTCHCLSYYVHLVHTRIPFFHTRVPMEGHRRRQRIYPLWW